MAADLLLAPAIGGKTAYAIARIHAVRRAEPLAAIWVILPSNVQVAAFRRRLAAEPVMPAPAHLGGALGVRLGTFYAVYAELLAEAGTLVACLDEPVLYRLLRDVVADLHARGELEFFARVRDKPGFIRLLHATIQELKRARLAPETFASKVQGREARLGELARIYAGYQARLLASDWVDDEGRGWLAALALQRDPLLARSWRLLVVDGFDEFNSTQLEVMRLLASSVPETLITMTGADRERLAHRRFARARRQLEATLDLRRVPDSRAVTPAATPELARLEAALFERPSDVVVASAGAPHQPPAIEFVRAATRATETRAALRWIKARIVRDGCAPRETALLARDGTPYRALIEETAGEFGLPVRFMDSADLIANPAIAALIGLLALPLEDYPHRAVVDAWRSPYFDWSAQGIVTGDAERLDAVARRGQVSAGRAQWQDTLARLAQAPPDDDGREDDEAPLAAPAGAAAAALRRTFDAFCARLETPGPAATFRDHAAWIEALIGPDPDLPTAAGTDPGLQVVARARAAAATAERDVAALRAFKDVLRALVLGQSVQSAGQRPVAYAEFWTELRGAVEAATVHTPPPPGHDHVVVTSALGARGLSFRAVALLGMAEGEFPRASVEDPLLTDADRAWLGLAPRLSGDEVTIFYEAVTRAREHLLLTRPDLADDGQPWEPSPYWLHVRERIAPHAPETRATDSVPLDDCASVAEWVSQAAAAEWAPPTAGVKDWAADVPSRLQAAAHGAAVLAARLSTGALSPFDGDLSTLHKRLAADYPPTRAWSASRLETYGACGYSFFAAHALELEPRPAPEAGYDARQFGSMLHAVLEQLYQSSGDAADVEALLAALPAVARAVFDSAPERYGFRPSALWQQQRRELEALLADSVRALAAFNGGWTPVRFELAFGIGETPPLVVQRDGTEVRLRGYIDRVDRHASGALRVIDYKTGSTPIRDRDLQSGVRLQLPLYAQALRAAGLDESVASGFYWHVGAAKPSSLQLEMYPGGVDAALDIAAQYAVRHVSRALAGDFAPRPPADGCPVWCPAAAFCWHYRPRRH
ncbi:MAG: PD-(D/E)XK nuclease family protein [Chloroflexi bacterium]|nr:PD-(D/E)XK nuclease family protein [Chloroflexota bacterium]